MNTEYLDVTLEQKGKILERLEALKDAPKENKSLNKVVCPFCNEKFRFSA